jgi:hypothetical protein
VLSELVDGFASSSSSCLSMTGCAEASPVVAGSMLGGVVVEGASLLLDRPVVAPPRPPPRPALATRGFGGIVTEATGQNGGVVSDSSRKSYLVVLIDKSIRDDPWIVVTRDHMRGILQQLHCLHCLHWSSHRWGR